MLKRCFSRPWQRVGKLSFTLGEWGWYHLQKFYHSQTSNQVPPCHQPFFHHSHPF
ncbi:hypothetical protein HanXRQr2_Chr10g0430171 [Helianthus annuus]|uniref:Uncharacterized protein n=1 Tax=Helianthus annuus TaxID=4232 RepID=A0A9K3N3C5_HELAN|nr:hypothetical protein HanXRQr2_Chr10g0430171 [Helianthus annuus]KAJ0513114.1 hypothetical protein HanHA300_Chr10g0353761 [Helianthus annuus]KAJ0529235.1 hypothetical protein HanHA89_Chr10g0375431 [Helianthus annuus]KAJ0696118.1 hypothetical protein HanLR1_Chr10g0353291 [Helianthus annuus]